MICKYSEGCWAREHGNRREAVLCNTTEGHTGQKAFGNPELPSCYCIVGWGNSVNLEDGRKQYCDRFQLIVGSGSHHEDRAEGKPQRKDKELRNKGVQLCFHVNVLGPGGFALPFPSQACPSESWNSFGDTETQKQFSAKCQVCATDISLNDVTSFYVLFLCLYYCLKVWNGLKGSARSTYIKGAFHPLLVRLLSSHFVCCLGWPRVLQEHEGLLLYVYAILMWCLVWHQNRFFFYIILQIIILFIATYRNYCLVSCIIGQLTILGLQEAQETRVELSRAASAGVEKDKTEWQDLLCQKCCLFSAVLLVTYLA